MQNLKKLVFNLLPFIFVAVSGASYAQFIKNQGQLIDFNQELVDDVLFYQNTGAPDYYFTKNIIQYFYKQTSFKSDKDITEEENYKLFMKDSIAYARIDMIFLGSNEDVEVTPLNQLEEYHNYYQAHIQNGITNVVLSEGVFYENIYENIDVAFYIKNGQLKYDIKLNEGARIENVELFFEGCKNIKLKNNELLILILLGDVRVTFPRSFELNKVIKIDKDVKNDLNDNVICFDVVYNRNNKLVIDPQVVWQTLYEQSFGIGTSNSIDSKGNQLVNVGYTFSANYPVLDPGGSTYYQASVAGSGDFRIVQFDTSGVRQWSTYYGGTDYDHSLDVAIDNNDIIIIVVQ